MRRFPWMVVLYTALQVSQSMAAERTIYRCETAAGVVFADRPCGADSEPYSPDTASVSVMTTVPAAPA